MVGITHVSIHEANFDLCLNFMYVSWATTCVCFQGLCDRSCVVFLKRGIFDFPFVCNSNERSANVNLILNG